MEDSYKDEVGRPAATHEPSPYKEDPFASNKYQVGKRSQGKVSGDGLAPGSPPHGGQVFSDISGATKTLFNVRAMSPNLQQAFKSAGSHH